MSKGELKMKAQEWAFLYFAALPNSVREAKWKNAEENEEKYMHSMENLKLEMEQKIIKLIIE